MKPTIVKTYERMAKLNDMARKYLCMPYCKPVITCGLADLSQADMSAVLHMVRHYDHWPEGDDPYGEHDFGAFDHNEIKYFWKIDYYDKALEYGSDDPLDGTITTRVLTIMRADEY